MVPNRLGPRAFDQLLKQGLILPRMIQPMDRLLVKRISRRLDGVIDVISDNPQYARETIGPDRMHELRIVARVVYYCRPP